jgi:transaldolase
LFSIAMMLEVHLYACGLPKRSMGWYHAKQLLDKKFANAKLTNVIEPFLMNLDPVPEDFSAWMTAAKQDGVAFHASTEAAPRAGAQSVALICGRTAENPKFFSAILQKGFKTIFLEKPGAPTVREIAEMSKLAKAAGAKVFLGYNRNFSKYVKDAVAESEQLRAQNVTHEIVMGRNDCFAEDELPECFDRNREGMLANMMCHELMVLVSYFGLKACNIKEIVVDRNDCAEQTLDGVRDFRRMRFSILTRDGQVMHLWGDRCGGEYCEAIIKVQGAERMRAIRPDAALKADMERLEVALPGCQKYFYLQDKEYLDLKQTIFSHVADPKSPCPQGVVCLDAAVEVMEVIDLIQKELERGTPTIALSIANHPSSWGVDFADSPTNPPWRDVIRCIGKAGFDGTELGPVGYFQSDELANELRENNLSLVAGNIFEKLHVPSEMPAVLEKVHTSCRTLREHGAKYFVIVPTVVDERVPTAGRPADAIKLDSSAWTNMMTAIVDVAKVTQSYGIYSVVHPHAGSWLETETEVDQAMCELPQNLVGLCLDTGHFAYAGMDPVVKYNLYASRTPFMHFKDVNGTVLKSLQAQKQGFWEGVTQGVFCPLGNGLVNFPALLTAMKKNNFSGWVTVEQDFDNKIPDVDARLMEPFQCSKANLEFLRSLGVQAVERTAGIQYTGRFDGSNSTHASSAMAAMQKNLLTDDAVSNLPTSTKWSVLSSRVEGLVAELNQLVGKQDAYCVSVSGHEGKAMEAVRQKMLETPWGQEWADGKTMFSYGEEMSTDPLEALFLKQLVFMAKPQRVLEVGMFVGYGAAAMLEGSPSVQVVSLEIDPYLKGWFHSCLTKAGCADELRRHETMLGPALDSLPKLTGSFDMVFVDANKAEYKQYVQDILSMNLLAPGGVIVCDNVLYNGIPYTASHFDAQVARRAFGDAIKEFNQWIQDHPDLEQVMLPIRDGISIVRRRGDAPGGVTRVTQQVCQPSTEKVTSTGNLVRYDDTWHIQDATEKVPAGAEISNCRIDVSRSEYQTPGCEGAGPKAWWSKSSIEFKYRVVEVPRGTLLNPASDALIFGHLEPGSEARKMAEASPQRRLIVIDKTVHGLYGESVIAYFTARGVVHEMLVLDTCEENKTVELTLEIAKKMKSFNIDRRKEPIIAIGGGVCLDVVGLAASLFRRRTPYIRVPTTALAYVDASVGAKNGCNFCGSKNRLGTYVPPAAAFLDSSFFGTQGERDISNSLGEMCKMAIMKSAELLDLLEHNGPRLIKDKFAPKDLQDDVPARVLQLSIQTMLEELTPNLWEDCLDRLVDCGHAVGQNLEMNALGTDVELMHGEAVATDMAFMTVLANVLGELSDHDRDRILKIFATCGLPTHHPMFTRAFFKEAITDRIQNSLGMRLPLPVGFGKARMFNAVSDEQFEQTFCLWEKLCKDTTIKVGKSPEAPPVSNTLSRLAQSTVIVADTGDLESIKICKPTDVTTNPSLILKVAKMPQYKLLVQQAVSDVLHQSPNAADKLALMVDRCCVNFGAEALKVIPGVVSTEVDARLSYDTEATVQRARRIIDLYQEKGFGKDRILIKLAATWEGAEAARQLEAEGIHCNLTLLFGFCQAQICAEAGVTLISPFVGRITDWYKNQMKVDGFKPNEDPGCKSVKRIFNYYKKHDIKTVVMGASFRNLGQILELAGVDRLTIDPKYVQQLEESDLPVEQMLTADSARQSTDDTVRKNLTRTEFLDQLAADPMANEKLAEGIKKFSADTTELEVMLGQLLEEQQPVAKLSKPTFNVAGLAFVVTGSTSGLGREIARCLAQQGARAVLIHGTSSERGNEVVKMIQSECPECQVVFHAADLQDPQQCISVIRAAEQAFGRIDGLVNSAATCFPRGSLEDTTVELWDSMFQLNTRAVFLLSQAVSQHMKANGIKGSIVNIASIAAQGGASWITAYSASKAAVCSLTKTNAFELRPHGIRVNAINMGWCLTDKEDQGQRGWRGEDWLEKAEADHPMGRLMRPIDVAGTVGHLLSDAALMLTGSIIDFAPEQITGTYA